MFRISRSLKRGKRVAAQMVKRGQSGPTLSHYHRRLVCETLESRTLLSVTLADLPVAAQQAIVAEIANDSSSYLVTRGAAGVTLSNLANDFTAQAQAGAIHVSAGLDAWDMALAGLDFGSLAQPLGAVQTSVHDNRVDFDYGVIDEWYVNTPRGLEQGFTVPSLPPSDSGGYLTVSLALGGTLMGTVNATGDGMTLSRSDGSVALGYSGLTAFDAAGSALPASLEVLGGNGIQTLLIHVNTAGAIGPITIDPYVQQAKLTASDGAPSANFGYSVAISGSTVVVGVPNANAAYVFTQPGGGWSDMTQTAKLSASDSGAHDEFGFSVSISGNTVVVAAPNSTGSIAGRAGAAYVFTQPASGWANMLETAKLTPSDGATGPWFGQSVAISGDTVVVGATGTVASGYPNTGTGAAYVFTKPSAGWASMTQTAVVTASDGAPSDNFGADVSIDGRTLVVGALGATIGTKTSQGAAYVFVRPIAGWATANETAKLTASDGAANDLFGGTVSISGNTVAVGAWGANSSRGAAYVFVQPTAGWASATQTAKLTASDGAAGDNFGFSVSVSFSNVVVAAPDATVNGNIKQGAAYLFTKPVAGWVSATQTAKLIASDGAAGDLYGSSVAINGATVVAGADNAIGGQGAAYVAQSTSPFVTSVVPPVGPLAGGTTVTIYGSGFTGATAVKFGTASATNLVVNSATQITVTNPSGTVGAVDVTVTTPNGTSIISAADQFNYVTVPTVTSVSPTAGPLVGGTVVTITGTSFAGASTVYFGTIAATAIYVASSTQIQAVAPAESAGMVDVTVVGAGGTSGVVATDHYTYAPIPVVTSVAPLGGPLAGGTTVTIIGTGFTGATVVDFGAVAATNVVVVSATKITASSPTATVTGPVDVTVTTPGGVSGTSVADLFTYQITPVVTAITPTEGPLAGGTSVTITGSYFTGTTVVAFGTIPASNVVVVSDTEITANSPPQAAGMVDVTVTAPGGISAASAADQFTYVAPPVVTGINPPAGPLAGGTMVTIDGSGFNGATMVTFGTIAATGVTVISDTQVTVIAPAEPAGTVNVTVTAPGGVSANTTADHFTYTVLPIVMKVTPISGPSSGGTTVGIIGANFTGATEVDFGAIAATNFTVVSATQITATTPAEVAGTVDVLVVTPGGYSGITPADNFTFVAAPDVTGVSPYVGPLAGGTSVTIAGVHFTGATAVKFGTVAATNVVVVSDTQITATSPAEGPATVDVTVTTIGGTSGNSPADQFTYLAAPAVTGVSPTAGPLAGGRSVTITGANFSYVSAVGFGAVAASTFIVDSPTQITAVTPAEMAGTVNVLVTTPGGISTISPADQYTYTAAPVVTGVSPAVGPSTGGLSVTITGLGFTGAPLVTFGSVPASSFVVDSPTQITAVCPPKAPGTVDISVTGPGGVSIPTVADQFTYLPAPVVTGISPATGPAVGGTTVTITGVDFNGATLVRFGSNPATNVVVVSPTQITVTSPAGTAGTVDVIVTAIGGVSSISSADRFTYVAAPVVTGVLPTAGPLAGGTSVTIAGAGFTGATGVYFGTTAATNVVVVSPTRITATSPAEAAGTVDVSVMVPVGGTSASSPADQFTYVAAPTVTGVSPSAGPLAGGTSVTITGTDFSGASVVKFGSLAATSVVVVSATRITATCPAATAGTVDVSVTNAGGTSATALADQFTYMAAPAVIGINPTAGPLAGGASVTVTGTSFTGATIVKFGAVAATSFVIDSDIQITAITPAELVGQVDVIITGPGGTSATSSADRYSYLAVPTVTGISISQGPAAGGTSVVIRGTGFTAATAVSFGTVAATNVVIDSPIQITVISPASPAGMVDVTATTLGGVSPTSAVDQFTYLPAPAVTSISPIAGPLSGGTSVTISGTGFSTATGVNFGSIPATNVVVISSTEITATSPAAAVGAVDVTVISPGGISTTSSADLFSYLTAPVVTGISPAAGPLAGGTLVTISGTSFTSATKVEFGGIAASELVVVSPTQITAKSPAESAGTVDVRVTGPFGVSSISSADQFTYVVTPVVTAISPAQGPAAGGSTVTITGTGFTAATSVDFGAVAAANVVINSDTQITVTTPAMSAGTVDVTVTSPGGLSGTSSAGQFTYLAAPTVASLSPVAGPLAGGTVVTITGTGLTGATAVSFGSIAATNIMVSSDTTITATSPAGPTGAVDVVVTTPGGVSLTSSADRFAYVTAPDITGVNPAAGPLMGGTLVTITGVGFSGATAVSFGNVPAANVVLNSDTQITVTSPAASAGVTDVTVTGPGGASAASPADQFTYMAVPAVSGISPTAGPLAGGTSVVITGTGFSGATMVTFGSFAASSVVINSPTQITAVSPPESTGTVNVLVVGPGGSSPASPAGHFSYLVAPSVTAVSPAKGPLGGGTLVTIVGSGLTGATLVKFGNFAASNVVVNSSTQITATSPAQFIGTVDVTVASPGGVSAISPADRFGYVAAPSVAAISPAQGLAAGGTSVTITGTGFTAATAVKFGPIVATNMVLVSATQITVTSPAGASGLVDVTVTGPGGVSATSSADQFTYLSAPVVAGISPNAGPLASGTSVTITGTGFTSATAVYFGAYQATNVVVSSATQITAKAPAGLAGTVDVTVVGPGGTSAASSLDQFTYLAPPTITGLSPAAGGLSGGTSVLIAGTGFYGTMVVKFGTVVASNVVVSPTQIAATSPAGSGTVDVTVTSLGGTSATSSADQFTFVAAPSVTALSTTQGPASGGTWVTITGTNFSSATAVMFGAIASTSFAVDSANRIIAISPAAAAGTVDVTVIGPGGASATSSSDQFTYWTTPAVTSISPTAGPTAGGTSVIITGSGFAAATAVKFGSAAATSVVLNSSTQITATSPAGSSGTVDVTVTGPGGISATSAADQFTYIAAPAITKISPAIGPLTGSTTVTITGTGFTGATGVYFGTAAATNVVVVSATQVTASSPAHSAGIVDVTVATPGGVSAISAADKFTYQVSTPVTPVVTAVSPSTGSVAGGTTVTITGLGFTGATLVNFGTVAATNLVVVSTTQITVTSPAQPVGVVDVTVTSPGGTSAVSSADQFTYTSKTTIAGMNSAGEWWEAKSAGSFVFRYWGGWNPNAGWQFVQQADVNGDGKADIVGMTSSGQWFAAISTPTGSVNQAWGGWNPNAGWTDVHAADVNGDGKADIVGRTASGGWYAALSTGTSFTNQYWGSWNPSANWSNVQIADANGDGKADIVGMTSSGGWYVALSTGTSFTNQNWGNWNPGANWSNVQVADVNGDGKADLVGMAGYGGWYVALSTGTSFTTQNWGTWNPNAGWTNVQVGDVNGDGKADIVGMSSSGDWYAALSTGTSFTTQHWGSWNPNAGWSNVFVADMNGDGKADIVGMTSSGAWYVALTFGTGSVNQAWGGWNPSAGWQTVLIGPFV
jgi:hypothetical protein